MQFGRCTQFFNQHVQERLFRQACPRVCEQAEQDGHDLTRVETCGWGIALEALQDSVERGHGRVAKVIADLAAEVAKGTEHAQLAQHHAEKQRIVRSWRTGQRLQVLLIEFFQELIEVRTDQLLAVFENFKSAVLVHPHTSA